MYKKYLTKLILENENKIKVVELAKKANLDISDYKIDQLAKGIKVEKEHDTNDEIDVVKNDTDLLKIAIAHLREDPNYYDKLEKVEGK